MDVADNLIYFKVLKKLRNTPCSTLPLFVPKLISRPLLVLLIMLALVCRLLI